MDADLDTLATALYVRIDDLLKTAPERAPWRPATGIAPKVSDAELVTMAVLQALLGYVSEARWLRHARKHLRCLFPYLPGQSGYNKRMRKLAATMGWLTRILATDTSVWGDDVWVIDSTPVECGRSRQIALRSDLAGWAKYGYCASHSRYFWGLRLHLLTTLHGLPVGFALTGAKADERQVLLHILGDATSRQGDHPHQRSGGGRDRLRPRIGAGRPLHPARQRLHGAHGSLLLSLGDGPTLRAAAGSVLYLALIALLSLGVATALRDSAASITVTLGLLYIVPILAGLGTLDPAWEHRLQRYGPMTAGLAIQATKNLNKLPIGPWPGLGVLAAWAAAALLAGGLLLRLRDA